MSPDEARDRFSEALEGDLDESEREAFDTLLDEDEELRAEYEAFADTLRMVSRLGLDEDAEPAPNLLPGFQERLRKRSRGRYYRDRFARRPRPGVGLPLLIAMALVLLAAIVWLAVDSSVVLEEPPAAAGGQRSDPSP